MFLSSESIYGTMKAVPIGVQSFREIRENNLYFIDKTELIDSILTARGTKAFLFTRPRRFGKSLNLSMIDAYLNKNYRDNSWFDDLEISELRPDDPEKNAYPVIMLDMKNLTVRTYETFIRRLRGAISDICNSFIELKDSDKQTDEDRELFVNLKTKKSDDDDLCISLMKLTSMLHKEYGKKVVVLIDEYDSPINNSYGKDFQHDVLEIIRDLLSSVLKGNESLAFGVVTGVMQIGKESIFSGLNNLKVNNILNPEMDEMFGFTADEVKELCDYYGHPDKFDEAKEWYDGYHFGNSDVYNPWSVLNYVDSNFRPEAYWGGTSGNNIIDDMLMIPEPEVYEGLVKLGSGEAVNSEMRMTVTFSDISSGTSGIYQVMAMTGYLTAIPSDYGYDLRLPNKEMYSVFAEIILGKIDKMGIGQSTREFCKAILSNDTEEIHSKLENILMKCTSLRILDKESAYQCLVLGILMNLEGNYRITADHESGEGFHDIRMERIRGKSPNVVIEIKRTRKNARPETLQSAAEGALKQIHDRKYAYGLSGETILYGIAFTSKTPYIVSETVISP